MAGSILYNDVDGFKSSLKGFIDVIDTMRFDGSLPYQTSRGNAAIWYQNLGINVLIAAAEMAKYQGIDLYSFKSKSGATIHDAVTFLLNSVQNTNLIHKYANYISIFISNILFCPINIVGPKHYEVQSEKLFCSF